MQWYVIVCMVVGLVLLFIELFQPGFGIFGISGFVLLILSIVFRAVFHKPEDDVLTQVFQLLLIYFIIIGGAFALFLVAHKKKWLNKTPFIQEETAVDADHSDGTENYNFLVGKTGVTLTDLHPTGKVVIEGHVYDVVAKNFFIEKDKQITVSRVEGVKIDVEIYKD